MKRSRIVALAVALLGLVAASRPALAKPAIAVLGIEIVSSGAKVDEATTRRAMWLTEALRHRAALASGPYELAPNSDKDLLELKLLSGCADEGRDCMAAIGRELGAERLLYGQLSRKGKRYRVSLKLLDVTSESMERTATDVLATPAKHDQVTAWASKLYNQLTGVPDAGVLLVATNADSGTVFIDGKVGAELTQGRARVPGLAEGIHTVAIEADGFAPYGKRITIVPGQRANIDAELEPVPSSVGDTSPKAGHGYRVAFWSTLLATGASGAAWAVTGLQVRDIEDEKVTALRELKTVDPGHDYSGNDACGAAKQALDDGVGAARNVVDICNRGEGRALLTNIFIASTVVSALASSYFYYKGYLGDRDEHAPVGAGGKSDATSVRVSPALGPDLLGAGLAIEF
jgi:hypothetical protein